MAVQVNQMSSLHSYTSETSCEKFNSNDVVLLPKMDSFDDGEFDHQVPPRKKMKLTQCIRQQHLTEQHLTESEKEKAFSIFTIEQPPINDEKSEEKMSPIMTRGSKVNLSLLDGSFKSNESSLQNLDEESYRKWQKEKCNLSPSTSSSTSTSTTTTSSVVTFEKSVIETSKCIKALKSETKQLSKEQEVLDEQINLLKKLIVYAFSPKISIEKTLPSSVVEVK